MCFFLLPEVLLTLCYIWETLNPLMPFGMSHSYHFDQSVRFKDCWMVYFIFYNIFIEHYVSKQWRT